MGSPCSAAASFNDGLKLSQCKKQQPLLNNQFFHLQLSQCPSCFIFTNFFTQCQDSEGERIIVQLKEILRMSKKNELSTIAVLWFSLKWTLNDQVAGPSCGH
uniref:Uncharacterized protein n=1 Tax=Micrurus corallinus TaxID=54390 RepID=A0A2D4FZ56_MICCO